MLLRHWGDRYCHRLLGALKLVPFLWKAISAIHFLWKYSFVYRITSIYQQESSYMNYWYSHKKLRKLFMHQYESICQIRC